MGLVLVTKEKYGDYYYPASTPEELAKSAFSILKERWDQGYWYNDPDVLDKESLKWSPDRMIENIVPDFPGWDVPEAERVAVINKYDSDLHDKYSDDKEVLELKLRKFKISVSEYKHRREYRKWYGDVKALIESGDSSAVVTFKNGRTSPLAWELLSERSDHEYESVELEPLQELSI